MSIGQSSCFAVDFADVRDVAEMPFVHGLHADIRLGRQVVDP
jgi:hypothetical protein